MGRRDQLDRGVRGERMELWELKVPQVSRAQVERGAIQEPRELPVPRVRPALLGRQPSRPRLG